MGKLAAWASSHELGTHLPVIAVARVVRAYLEHAGGVLRDKGGGVRRVEDLDWLGRLLAAVVESPARGKFVDDDADERALRLRVGERDGHRDSLILVYQGGGRFHGLRLVVDVDARQPHDGNLGLQAEGVGALEGERVLDDAISVGPVDDPQAGGVGEWPGGAGG
jgi:hypothetical protein